MTHSVWLIVVGGAIVVAATLLRFLRNSGHSRVRLRRSVILFVPYAAAAALVLSQPSFGGGAWLDGIRVLADLLALLLAVNLSALIVFDLVLMTLRLRVPDILHDLIVAAAYIVVMVWLMHRTGVNLASIVATSAVATAVIGLSLQSTLGSVIGGLALQVDDSLNEGDWIELENGKQGQVKKVRWRHTVIETRDWDTLLVPNNQLLSQTIKILGKRHGQPVQHRMWVYFHVDFRTPPADVIRVVGKALNAPLPGVASEPKPNTVCLDLARDHKESYALYATRYWLTDLAKDDPTSSLVRERIFAALKRAEIPLAIPAATLFVSNDDLERTKRKQREALSRILRALAEVELFRTLSEEELEQLAGAVRVAPFAAGEVVTRQGAKANWLYVLTEGSVDVCVTSSSGRLQKVNSLNAPAFFGEMALMTGAPREATVVAVDDIECLRVDRSAFRRLLETRPEIAREVAAVLAERKIELEAVKEHLDAAARSKRVEGERHRILSAVQDFFALKD